VGFEEWGRDEWGLEEDLEWGRDDWG